MATEVRSFGSVDYVVFGLTLAFSAGVGIFYAVWGKMKESTGEFLMGGRNMKTFPVAVSILVSYMSAILVLGTSAEMYTRGTEYYLYGYGISIGVLIAAVVFVPLLFPLKFTSSFEYLELRFQSKAVKVTGACIMVVQQLLYMGIASYAPATALEAVTEFPTWATIITIGCVATFYTSLGGMKAVVWTDVFQSVVMLAGLLAIVIQGSIAVGGIGEVWSINRNWNRINFFNFDPDPTVRHSFWSLIVGGAIGWTSFYGVNQPSVQRYCALPTLKKAKISVFINMIGIIVLYCLVCLVGITVFAYYVKQGCDPLSDKSISNSNQVVPYFVMNVLGYPGLPGLFISCLFSGALSSVSSSLNSLVAVVWEDFLKPVLHKVCPFKMSGVQETLITKFLVVIFGAAGVGMAFMAKNLGGTVVQASLSFTGAAVGPLLGLFSLGAFFPWANWIGAVVGGITGLVLPLWISIGAYSIPGTPNHLNFPTQNCSISNVTDFLTTTASLTTENVVDDGGMSRISPLYTVSYLWYPAIGTGTVIVVGLIVSVITGINHVGDVDTKYLSPIFDRIFCCLPAAVSRFLRCNQEFQDPKEIVADHEKGETVSSKDVDIFSLSNIHLTRQTSVDGISYKLNPDVQNTYTNTGFVITEEEQKF